MSSEVYTLPPDLPVPQDDGAADHLVGLVLPDLGLESSHGPVNVRDFGVVYLYPRTGRPGRETPAGWDAIPGARGCTPQSCAFRDAAAEFEELGIRVAGVSVQTLDDQREFAERNHIPYPVIADPERRLGEALRLPSFEVEGEALYKRLTLVADQGEIVKVFYPVFPPDENAGGVLGWLRPR